MAGKLVVAPSNDSVLFNDLKRLGFTEYESRVYIQLLRQSPATAYEISKSGGVPRPNAYNALEALTQRGAVLPVSENPTKYVAADPHNLFETIARQTNTLCTDLAGRLASLSPASDDQYVWSVKGEAAVRDRIDTMLAQSSATVWVKAGDEVLRHHKAALKAAAERGVDILIVLFGFDAAEFRFTPSCRVYIHEASGVRMGTTDNLFTLAVDHVEMLTAALDGDVVAAYTRNRPIVTMAESLIRHDYYMSEIFTRFGPEIEATFGPHLRDLRLAAFTPEQALSFRQKTGI